MSLDQLDGFLTMLSEDKELLEKLKKADDADAVAEVARNSGYEVTAEDVNMLTKEEGDLSDEALEAVSGGRLGAVIKGVKYGAKLGTAIAVGGKAAGWW